MRTTSNVPMRNALKLPTQKSVLLLDVATDPILRMNDGDTSIWVGGLEYKPGAGLGGVQIAKENVSLEVANLILTLILPDVPSLQAAVEEYLDGVEVTLSFVLLDNEDSPIGAPSVEYKGVVDSTSIVDADGVVQFIVNVENALADWQRTPLRRWTQVDQQKAYPGDCFFEDVEALQHIELIWPTREAIIEAT